MSDRPTCETCVFRFLINPGSASAEQVADVFEASSNLWDVMYGEGLDFEIARTDDPSWMEVSAMLAACGQM